MVWLQKQFPELAQSTSLSLLGKYLAANADTFRGTLLFILMLSVISSDDIKVVVAIYFLTAFWTWVFTRTRNEKMDWRFLYAAGLIALLTPNDLSLWQIMLCTSTGVVLGEQVFGGRHFSFLNAAVVTLAFMFYSFPTDQQGIVNNIDPIWLLLPLALLIIFRLINWFVVSGSVLGVAIAMTLTHSSLQAALSSLASQLDAPTSFGLCVCFILADTVVSARTGLGKLLSGALFGFLIVYLNSEFDSLEPLVFALLLTSVSVPLIDNFARQLENVPEPESNGEKVSE